MNTTSRRIAEVERYIHELAIALAGLPVDEREDVIAGVREHIDDAMLAIDDPSVADVQRILEDLGDPLAIAADAGARTTSPERRTGTWDSTTGEEIPPAAATSARTYPPGFDQPPPVLQRTWIPAATILAFPVAALLLWAGGPAAAAPAAAIWILGLVVLLASPLWSGVEKFVGAAVLIGLPTVLVVVLGSAYVWGYGGGPVFQQGRGFVGDIGSLSYYGESWLVAGLVLAVFVAIGALLLARGSARAHKPGSKAHT